jgi:hypothetical protein
MSARKLGLAKSQYEALKKTLDLLESGELIHMSDVKRKTPKPKFVFNMNHWKLQSYSCGSVCCIGGTAELVGNLPAFSLNTVAADNQDLKDLFYPMKDDMNKITTKQAAAALRNYLTTGKPNWECALS